MSMYTITYQKHFTSGTLRGLVTDDSLVRVDGVRLQTVVDFLESRGSVPVKALGGSDYVVSDVRVEADAYTYGRTLQ